MADRSAKQTVVPVFCFKKLSLLIFKFRPFIVSLQTMIDEKMNKEKWSENVIIVDADYVDRVAFDLTVNFERMLGRRVPKADMARWVECVALDGGLREGDHETQVVLIHGKKKEARRCVTGPRSREPRWESEDPT